MTSGGRCASERSASGDGVEDGPKTAIGVDERSFPDSGEYGVLEETKISGLGVLVG